MIREAKLTDVDGITHVHINSWQTSYRGIVPDDVLDNLGKTSERRKDWWETSIQDTDQFTYVAEDDTGEIVGFVSGGAERDDIPNYDCEIYAIYLLESAQGQGIGKQLLLQTMQTLRENGYRSLLIWVLKDNPSKGFYIQMGGTYIKEKIITIGGADLMAEAYGWDLSSHG